MPLILALPGERNNQGPLCGLFFVAWSAADIVCADVAGFDGGSKSPSSSS